MLIKASTLVVAAVVTLANFVRAAPSTSDTTGTLAPPFEINIGYNRATGNQVVWVAGQSKCNNVVIGAIGTNWCSRSFNLNGVSGLTAEGCGGPLWIDRDKQFFANCGNFSEKDQCGITTSYHCS